MRDLPKHLIQELSHRHLTLAVAESCTGGHLADLLTDVPGASQVFWGGVVVYDNRAKEMLLNVDVALIKQYGAVSERVARAMADGLRQRAGVDISIGITGIAGPSGGTQEKPVGTICIAVIVPAGELIETAHFTGTRAECKHAAAMRALEMLQMLLP